MFICVCKRDRKYTTKEGNVEMDKMGNPKDEKRGEEVVIEE